MHLLLTYQCDKTTNLNSTQNCIIDDGTFAADNCLLIGLPSPINDEVIKTNISNKSYITK